MVSFDILLEIREMFKSAPLNNVISSKMKVLKMKCNNVSILLRMVVINNKLLHTHRLTSLNIQGVSKKFKVGKILLMQRAFKKLL